MKNFLRKYLGLTEMESRLIDLSDEMRGLEESLKGELMDDLGYDLERQVEDQVDREVDDRLYNYDLDDMQSSIKDLKEDMNDFDHQVSAMSERVNVLADKLDTLSILDRITALEEKLND